MFRVMTRSPVLSLSSHQLKQTRTMEVYARQNQTKDHARHRPEKQAEKDTATPDDVDVVL